MTPESWPDAFGHSHSADGYQPLYTATQVREIVRMEVEQLKLDADEMVRQIGSAAELGLEYAQSELTNYDQSYDRHPSTEGGRSAITSDISEIKTAINDARKWLKENKDAD